MDPVHRSVLYREQSVSSLGHRVSCIVHHDASFCHVSCAPVSCIVCVHVRLGACARGDAGRAQDITEKLSRLEGLAGKNFARNVVDARARATGAHAEATTKSAPDLRGVAGATAPRPPSKLFQDPLLDPFAVALWSPPALNS